MYLRKHLLFQAAKFVTYWTTIIFSFSFKLNRTYNGEAFFQNQSGQGFRMKKFLYFAAAEEISML